MKTTLEMAREAGWPIEAGEELPNTGSMSLERLVALARADEREVCAKTKAGKPRELKAVGRGRLLDEQQF